LQKPEKTNVMLKLKEQISTILTNKTPQVFKSAMKKKLFWFCFFCEWHH